MKMKAAMIAVAMALPSGPSQAAGPSVVGTWAPDPATCTPVGGMIEIGPKSLTGDELACDFDDVARSGDAVTWHGRCSEAGAAKAATVEAVLTGDSLRVRIDGRDGGAYRRCSTGAAATTLAVEPWPGHRWRADIDENRDGHTLHVTMLGATTTTGKGDSVDVTCTDREMGTGRATVVRHHAWALSRQDDYEGDAGPLGVFSMGQGSSLRWFGRTSCGAGKITWKRL